MGNVKKIILIEDYAKGIDSKNIEVVLVGQYLNFEYISQLEDKIEKLIGRKVSFYLASKFLSDNPHIFIFNKDDENKEIKNSERPWGKYIILDETPLYKIKRIEVDVNGRLSYQYHEKRSETWVVIQGKV